MTKSRVKGPHFSPWGVRCVSSNLDVREIGVWITKITHIKGKLTSVLRSVINLNPYLL